MTFAEMRRDSVRCALWMRKLGIGPGDVVTICTNNQLYDYVPVLATFYVGAIFNPWSYGIELREYYTFLFADTYIAYIQYVIY